MKALMTSTARDRVMEGLAASIVEKGFAATTIADVARCAGVSKRTFYETFPDKNACFLALYREASTFVLAALRKAAPAAAPWPERIQAVASAYLTALRRRPALTRAFFLELNVAGAPALAARREVLGAFAKFLCDIAAEGHRSQPSAVRAMSPAMGLALAGGINELVLLCSERSRAVLLDDVKDTACSLILALTWSEGPEQS